MADRQSQQGHPSLTKAEWLSLWDRTAKAINATPGGHTKWAELLSKANDIGYPTKVIEKACEDAHAHALAWYPESFGHDVYYAALNDHFENSLIKAAQGEQVEKKDKPFPGHISALLKQLAPDMVRPAASVPAAPPSAKPATVENDPYLFPYKQAYWFEILNVAAKAGLSERSIEMAATAAGDFARFESAPERGGRTGENYFLWLRHERFETELNLPSTIKKLMILARPAGTQPVNIPETPVRTVPLSAVKNGWEQTPPLEVASAVKTPVSTRDSQTFDTFEQHNGASQVFASPAPIPEKASSSRIKGGYTYHKRTPEQLAARLDQVRRVEEGLKQLQSFAPRSITLLQVQMLACLTAEREAIEKGCSYQGFEADKLM